MKYICDYYVISRIQRNKEKAMGLGNRGTMGFEETGCYNCDGTDLLCDIYQEDLKLTKSELNDRMIIAGK